MKKKKYFFYFLHHVMWSLVFRRIALILACDIICFSSVQLFYAHACMPTKLFCFISSLEDVRSQEGSACTMHYKAPL